jgi:hypothetical protein
MIADQDDWDDTVIMKVFHDSLKKHKTMEKAEQKPSSQENTESKIVITPQETVHVDEKSANNVDVHDGKKRKFNKEEDNPVSKKPVGFQAALNNFLASKKKATPTSNKASTEPDQLGHCDNDRAMPSMANSQKNSGHVPSSTKSKVHFSDDRIEANYMNTAANPSQTTSFDSCQHIHSQHVFSPSNVTSAMIDDALQAMLMAWYQSGYATGRYQTLCEISGHTMEQYDVTAHHAGAADNGQHVDTSENPQ